MRCGDEAADGHDGPVSIHDLVRATEPGLAQRHPDEVVPLSVRVTSLDAIPLVVERAMYWGTPPYAGHAGRAVSEPRGQARR